MQEQLTWEDERTPSLAAGGLPLTGCTAPRSTCRLFTAHWGRGYAEKRAGFMIPFIVASEPSRVEVAIRACLTEHRDVHCRDLTSLPTPNKASVKEVL